MSKPGASKHGALGWVVLGGIAAVMIGSAVVADPPTVRAPHTGDRLFPIGMVLAEHPLAIATTSFEVSGDELVAGFPFEGCLAVPAAESRSGGEVLLLARDATGSGPPRRLLLRVERGAGSSGRCADFEPTSLLFIGMLDELRRVDGQGVGLQLANATDEELTVRVRITAAADHVVPSSGTTWLDVQHRRVATG